MKLSFFICRCFIFQKNCQVVLFVLIDKGLLDSSFIYRGDMFLKRFVKFRGILVVDEVRL